MTDLYRTLISGEIVQQSGLSVGGRSDADDSEQMCHRNGENRFTMTGSGMCGALFETATRIFPDLIVGEKPEQNTLKGAISSKTRQIPKPKHGRKADPKGLIQSVWRFCNAHVVGDVKEEWRQGVGIRQKTGASAVEKEALFDVEFLPRGTRWTFFLEIDTFRGTAEAEAIAVLALNHWVNGYGWLGRSAARGMGWIRFCTPQVVRLPRTTEMLELWPDNTRTEQEIIDDVLKQGAVSIDWNAAVTEATEVTKGNRRSNWSYVSFDVELSPGKRPDEYGLDVLQVSGHPGCALEIDTENDIRPLSVRASEDNWMGDDYKIPDAPFVATTPFDRSADEPFLPGGGVRGPLRHTVSKLRRGKSEKIHDPNDKADYEKLREKHKQGIAVYDDVTKLFGTEMLGSRILVRDGEIKSGDYQILRGEHHAEDEFTAGVHASSKFDRNVLVKGDLTACIVLEAESSSEIREQISLLLPALEMARLGFVPMGGSKWRGAGWLPWKISNVRHFEVKTDTVTEKDSLHDVLESPPQQNTDDLEPKESSP